MSNLYRKVGRGVLKFQNFMVWFSWFKFLLLHSMTFALSKSTNFTPKPKQERIIDESLEEEWFDWIHKGISSKEKRPDKMTFSEGNFESMKFWKVPNFKSKGRIQSSHLGKINAHVSKGRLLNR